MDLLGVLAGWEPDDGSYDWECQDAILKWTFYTCADLLSGSAAGALLCMSEVGRRFVGLLSPSAAFFASLSTDLFPVMFAWLGTHWTLRWGSLCFLVVLLREVMSMSVIMWPDKELNAVDAQMAAWLSTPM